MSKGRLNVGKASVAVTKLVTIAKKAVAVYV
jgi:hypothetical protein